MPCIQKMSPFICFSFVVDIVLDIVLYIVLDLFSFKENFPKTKVVFLQLSEAHPNKVN